MSNVRLELKRLLWEEHREQCMAWYFVRHQCLPAPDLHEALYSRAGIPKSHQGYIYDRHNVITACNHVHLAYGQTRWFKKQAAKVLVALYGDEAIRFYLDTAPFVAGRENLDAILAGPDPPEGIDYRWIEPRIAEPPV